MMQRTFYPEIEAWDTGMLPVSKIHTVYYEQSGNKNGKPVIFGIIISKQTENQKIIK